MSRLTVRIRLTLAFALAMAVVLSAVGAFLYLRLGASLAEQLDEGLLTRSQTLSALVRDRGGRFPDAELPSGDDEGFAQALRPDGTVLASSRSVRGQPLVSPRELARARAEPFFLRRDSAPALPGQPVRLHVATVRRAGEALVLVVGASLEDRQEALNGLLAQLLIVGPLALLVSSGAGYLLAAAALRPVEAMRRRASGISSDRPGGRLPLPRTRDEIHRLGATLNAMLGRLEAGLERERRFVADASHELRTPLALLRTELELAQRQPRSREELGQALDSVAEEVERLARLAEDLLVLARADEGGQPLRRDRVSTRDLLESVAARFTTRAEAAGRPIELAAGDHELLGDRARLEQALGNLVDNALRHGAGSVRLEAERRAELVELRVLDTGEGFSPEFLPRAFDRFTRADEARGRSGAGLGLAIAAAIARRHGGRAHAENGPTGGAVVTLALPPE
ncbi:MAG: HAMP domain-containing protein [Actinobacteria bacterium]|nr:HAMP domain-containing protein [Actinomycetota bacterium]